MFVKECNNKNQRTNRTIRKEEWAIDIVRHIMPIDTYIFQENTWNTISFDVQDSQQAERKANQIPMRWLKKIHSFKSV